MPAWERPPETWQTKVRARSFFSFGAASPKSRAWRTGGGLGLRLATIIAGVTFALDQATKLAVVQGLNLIERGVIEVFPPFLVFRMAWNRGINFGLLANDSDLVRWGLIVVSVIIAAWVWIWVKRDAPGRMAQVSAGLLMGGAMGNVIDRLLYGAVADFLNMSCCGVENPYVFNVADIAIFAGAFGLVLFTGGTAGGTTKGGSDPQDRRKRRHKTP